MVWLLLALVIEGLESALGKHVAKQAEKIPLGHFPGPIDQKWHRTGGLHVAELSPHMVEQSERLAAVIDRESRHRTAGNYHIRRRHAIEQARHPLDRQIEKSVL